MTKNANEGGDPTEPTATDPKTAEIAGAGADEVTPDSGKGKKPPEFFNSLLEKHQYFIKPNRISELLLDNDGIPRPLDEDEIFLEPDPFRQDSNRTEGEPEPEFLSELRKKWGLPKLKEPKPSSKNYRSPYLPPAKFELDPQMLRLIEKFKASVGGTAAPDAAPAGKSQKPTRIPRMLKDDLHRDAIKYIMKLENNRMPPTFNKKKEPDKDPDKR